MQLHASMALEQINVQKNDPETIYFRCSIYKSLGFMIKFNLALADCINIIYSWPRGSYDATRNRQNISVATLARQAGQLAAVTTNCVSGSPDSQRGMSKWLA